MGRVKHKTFGGILTYSKKNESKYTETYCSYKECATLLNKNQLDYSMRIYGRPLCYGHQKQLEGGGNNYDRLK
jgi:hypothetical protein